MVYPVVIENVMSTIPDGSGHCVVPPACKEKFLVRWRDVDSC